MQLEADVASLDQEAIRAQILEYLREKYPTAEEIEFDLLPGSVVVRVRLIMPTSDDANATRHDMQTSSFEQSLSSRLNVTVVPANFTVQTEIISLPPPPARPPRSPPLPMQPPSPPSPGMPPLVPGVRLIHDLAQLRSAFNESAFLAVTARIIPGTIRLGTNNPLILDEDLELDEDDVTKT